MISEEKGQVMTANRLKDGEVVFLTRAGGWSEKIDEAALALEPLAVAALEASGSEAEQANVVTGHYFFNAARIDAKIRADHIRERIRSLGPSVRLDLGKQADGTAGNFEPVEA